MIGSRFIEDKTTGDLFRLDSDNTWEPILPHKPQQVSEEEMNALLKESLEGTNA